MRVAANLESRRAHSESTLKFGISPSFPTSVKDVIEWLLERSQPAVRYQTLVDILDADSEREDVQEAHSRIPKAGWAAEILRKQLPGIREGNALRYQGYWHNYVLLNRPKYVATLWKFLVLIDLGLTAKNTQVMKSCQLLSERYLKREEDFHLCTTSNITRAFISAGFDEDHRISRALDWIVSEQKEDGGWHCFGSPKGTLDCWEPLSVFAVLPRDRWNRGIKKSTERGAEFYLERKLYREGARRYAPWFRLHYPIHYYYDMLVGLEALASLGYGTDPRMKYALELLLKRRKPDGRWVLDAIHPDLPADLPKDEYSSSPPYEPFPSIPWGLEEVGKPSKMITLRALRVLKRVEGLPNASRAIAV